MLIICYRKKRKFDQLENIQHSTLNRLKALGFYILKYWSRCRNFENAYNNSMLSLSCEHNYLQVLVGAIRLETLSSLAF